MKNVYYIVIILCLMFVMSCERDHEDVATLNSVKCDHKSMPHDQITVTKDDGVEWVAEPLNNVNDFYVEVEHEETKKEHLK